MSSRIPSYRYGQVDGLRAEAYRVVLNLRLFVLVAIIVLGLSP